MHLFSAHAQGHHQWIDRKRREMMDGMQQLRERQAELGNDIESLDRTLEALGDDPIDLPLAKPRSSRTMLFHRNELKRFLLDQMRHETEPISSRTLAEQIAKAEARTGGTGSWSTIW